MAKYLDENGVSYLWSKMTNYVDQQGTSFDQIKNLLTDETTIVIRPDELIFQQGTGVEQQVPDEVYVNVDSFTPELSGLYYLKIYVSAQKENYGGSFKILDSDGTVVISGDIDAYVSSSNRDRTYITLLKSFDAEKTYSLWINGTSYPRYSIFHKFEYVYLENEYTINEFLVSPNYSKPHTKLTIKTWTAPFDGTIEVWLQHNSWDANFSSFSFLVNDEKILDYNDGILDSNYLFTDVGKYYNPVQRYVMVVKKGESYVFKQDNQTSNGLYFLIIRYKKETQINYKVIKSIQRGNASAGASTIKISPVNLNKSIILLNGSDSSGEPYWTDFLGDSFTLNNAIEYTSWQVIEFY